jgi:hypothetical protein
MLPPQMEAVKGIRWNGAASQGHRATSGEPRAASREPRAASREPQATSHGRRAKSREPRAANPGRRFPIHESLPFPGLPASGGPRSLSASGGSLRPAVPFFTDFLPIGMEVIHNGSSQLSHVKFHQIRVKIDQKGDVFRQKAIKKARISSCPS